MQGVVIEELVQVAHSSAINAFCYNARLDRFATTDERSIKLWHRDGEIRSAALPARTSNLVQTIEYIPSRNLYVASCLDGALRFYDEHMDELAVVFTHRASILCLAFDEPRQRILTGGVDGCGAWVLRGKDWDGYEHEGQTLRNPAYQVAASDAFTRTGTTWVQRMKLDLDRVYFLSNNAVHVYCLLDNSHVETIKKLVKNVNGAITDFVVYKQKAIVVGCMDGSIYVATLNPRSTLAVFKDHTKPITGLAFDDVSQSVFSSSLDGTIRMWDLDLLRNIHQIRMDAPVAGLFLVPKTNPIIFAVQSRQAMRLLLLKYTLKEHSATASPLAILFRALAPGKQQRHKPSSNPRPPVMRRKVSQIPIHLMASRTPTTPPSRTTTTAGDNLSDWSDTHVVSMCQDRSVRIYATRRMNVPSATWTPDEAVLQDVIGIAYNPYVDILYILLKKRIAVYDVALDVTTPIRWIEIENRVVKAICCVLAPPIFHLHSQRTDAGRRGAIVQQSRSDYLAQAALEAQMGVHWLACGSDKGDLLFSSSMHGSLDEALLQPGHAAPITYLAFTSVATATLVSFAHDKTLGLWRTAPRMTRLAMITLGEVPSCMSVSPTAQLIVCGFEDGRVDFVDFACAEPKLISSEVNHSSMVIAADCSDELHLCVTTSFDMSIKVWDQSKNLLREVQMSTPLSCMCFANAQGDLFVGILEKLFTLVAVDVLPTKLPLPRALEPPSTAAVLESIVDSEYDHETEEATSNQEPFDAEDTEEPIGDPFEKCVLVNERPHTPPDPEAPPSVTLHARRHRRPVPKPLPPTANVPVYSPPVLRPLKPSSTLKVDALSFEPPLDDPLLPALGHYDVRTLQFQTLKLAKGSSRKRDQLRPSVPVQIKPPHKPTKSGERPAAEDVPTPLAPIFDAHVSMPAVTRTPRKLWNAIGAEDRRLIVLQRRPGA
ncbi:hypothetical protein SPRG_06993 [Saprolegnia parasitica CBS 223.65]|uniref:Anaphase-promoting complex subunit 4 WD40 domain-containing protein n=1 Tax=Saprolegnia parasitica (strain CBS 223.65) TaxID=695850 RepID=A0A067CLI2_SAPPC|nr:hypothetical protein SPRG_06993 [Saprolegnia parasitica CBS 223.65]KDO27406.1 hypothetical protein SPRG_06993 [Saprolegnia parasitica CBS 223.65]|eukprot:XP_012201846.1 hypothetical protein SPRG_06993 [Saprolegnia parasitica CBS 223.65]